MLRDEVPRQVARLGWDHQLSNFPHGSGEEKVRGEAGVRAAWSRGVGPRC